ncbi:MAG: hypothetical protein IT374_10905 [Polyangiaceae bacterium]|nr:hypothetical protein [Polyangiaceae bacterium]
MLTSRALLAALALGLPLGACSAGPPSAPPPALPPAPQASASSSVEPIDPNAAAVADMMRQVAAARQLAQRSPLRSLTLARRPLIAKVRAHVDEEVPRDAVRGQGELLVGLGLLPPSYDYEKGVFDLLEAQLAGFYEPGDKTMYLAADLGRKEADATLAHELVHALQDQHWDLGPKLRFRPDAGDATSAVHALAEGDAMSAMLDVLLRPEGRTAIDAPDATLAAEMRAEILLTPSLAEVPTILKASLVAPYVDGLLFVNRLRRSGGWRAVDDAWARPPETSEQLLHADKWRTREAALVIPMPPPDALGPGWKTLYTDTVGEQGVRLVFEEWGKRGAAVRAAEGWGGDRAWVMARRRGDEEELVAALWVRFDGAPAACREAEEAYELAARAAGGRPEREQTTCRERADTGPLVVARRGCDLLLVGGPYKHGGAKAEARGSCGDARAWAEGLLSHDRPRKTQR